MGLKQQILILRLNFDSTDALVVLVSMIYALPPMVLVNFIKRMEPYATPSHFLWKKVYKSNFKCEDLMYKFMHNRNGLKAEVLFPCQDLRESSLFWKKKWPCLRLNFS